MNKKIILRSIVLTWTALTTTFFWTSTMRILFKPEISSWKIFNFGGEGWLGDFWLPLLIVIFSLFLFYLEGRGKFRLIYHFLLISWHLVITSTMIYGSLQSTSRISFGTWGIELDFIWLAFPFTLFLMMSIALVIYEVRNLSSIPTFQWNQIEFKSIWLVVLLFPIAFLFFQMGEGFDWLVKIAVVITIIQWLIMIDLLGRPKIKEPRNTLV